MAEKAEKPKERVARLRGEYEAKLREIFVDGINADKLSWILAAFEDVMLPEFGGKVPKAEEKPKVLPKVGSVPEGASAATIE